MKTITITTHSGIIQKIDGVPNGFAVEVKDYDEDFSPSPSYDDEEVFLNT